MDEDINNCEMRTPDMKFDNIVFTKHAKERLELRRISREMVVKTIRNPNKQFTESNGHIKFIRKVHGAKVHAICKPIPEENKWLVISVWVRGEDDYGNRKGYNKSYRKYGDKSLSNLWAGLIVIIGILLYIAWNFILK